MRLIGNLFNITSSESYEGKAKFGVQLNPQHPIYSYHFPGNPITPGVCLLQMVSELAETVLDGPLTVKEYVNVKYLNVIDPVTESSLSVEMTYNRTDAGLKLKASILGNQGVYTKISAIYE